eukprot:2980657-Pleurochrysis_carterae.AAC.2
MTPSTIKAWADKAEEHSCSTEYNRIRASTWPAPERGRANQASEKKTKDMQKTCELQSACKQLQHVLKMAQPDTGGRPASDETTGCV